MLNVVVVGAGTMGTVHAEAYQRMTQARLVAVVDIREDVGTALADRYGARHYLRLEMPCYRRTCRSSMFACPLTYIEVTWNKPRGPRNT